MSQQDQERAFEDTVLDQLSTADIEDFFSEYLEPGETVVVQEINYENFPVYCPE